MMNTFASAHEKVVVVPIGGAVGDAKATDVVKGKTFSSKEGKGLTGTLELNDASIGDAQDADVLAGKTFSNANNIGLSGAMSDNGAVTLIPDTTDQPIAKGYHDGNGTCVGDADLVPENIPAGVNIFGVVGPTYFGNNDGTIITDNSRRPMWQQADDGTLYNWYEAAGVYHATYNSGSKDACGDLDLGGHSDWRLPSKDELKSLVVCTNGPSAPLPDYAYCYSGYASPTIDSQFSCSSYPLYWSSSVYSSVYNADFAWSVHFTDGHADWHFRYLNLAVRCVR